MKRILLTVSILVATISIQAQEWMKVYRHDADTSWVVPMRIEQTKQTDFIDNGKRMVTNVMDALSVPFSTAYIDSIAFTNSIADDEKGHNKYKVFTLHIATIDERPLVEKREWIDCFISLDGKGEYSDYSGTGRIRGRGNSTWEWYDKKPFRIKLDEKSKLLGLDKAKDWNLMANYRDATDLMNAFAFEAARCMAMPHTNHTRFVELFLNEEFLGLYQLTEKIEVDNNRVAIDKDEGVLLSFDQDDGPNGNPDAGDNFFSAVYGLPMCVKHPDDPTAEQIEKIKEDFAELERAVKANDYTAVAELMDVESFIHILQLHEFLYNVEIDAPRSLYMFRDKGGKYTFGPVWDWDAGYDFDWGSMYTGHNFFNNHRKLIYGTQPADYVGAAYRISSFWTNMFHNKTFVAKYKELWAAVSDTILTHSWSEMEKYIEHLNHGAYKRDYNLWPITRTGEVYDNNFLNANTEIARMKQWLTDRLAYINETVANYPDDTSTPSSNEQEYTYNPDSGEILISIKDKASYGYSQIGRIEIDADDVANYLGGLPISLVPLNADGSTGSNTAAGTYGAWFDHNGNTAPWAKGHVYIESNELYSWAFGSHPSNCFAGHNHTVAMQYIRNKKKLTVKVSFIVE